MPTPLRRRLRLARRGAWYAVAIALVCVAATVGLISQLLPLAERHPQQVAAWLSERAGRPVSFDRLDTQWTRRGPLLRLEGLRIGAGADAKGMHGGDGDGVRIGQAEVLVAMYGGLLPGHSFTELRLRGLSLTLERSADGIWSVRGLPGQQSGRDPLDSLEGLGELQVIGGKLAIVAPSLGWNTRLPKIDLRLQVDGARVRAGARAVARQGGKPLQAALDFDRRRGDGRAYLQAQPADLSDWSALLGLAGLRVEAGHGRVAAWARLHDHRVAKVVADLQLQQVALNGTAAGTAPTDAPRADFDQVDGQLRWQLLPGGWQLDAPTLRIGLRRGDAAAVPQKLDGLMLAGGQRYAMRAAQVEAAPLFALLALSDRVEPGLRRWLAQARPDARLSALELAGAPGGTMYLQGHLDGVRFAPVGNAPGLNGLSGDFSGDGEGFALKLDPQARLRFDWPSGFGVVHDVALHGQVAAWRDGAGWRIGTPALRIAGADYAADARGGLWFQDDGTRPRIDLVADLDNAPVSVAKGFWIHYKMSREATDWLDAALAGGRIEKGHAIVSGELEDWPFDQNDGRFEATGRIVDGRIKFQPDWPALEQVDADIAFVGNGFSIGGKGLLDGVGIERFDAGIADFSETDLRVDARTGADAGRLLAMLRHSPLQKSYGEAIGGLEASGPLQASFSLLQPLRARNAARKRLDGTIELQGAKLADKRWDLAFDDVRGRADYDDGGFDAEALAVKHQGQSGELSLRAGSGVRDRQQAFEAELGAALAASDLLQHAPEMAWLKPYVDGRSQWTVGVSVPKGADASRPTLLRLRSDLVGTTLKLPAPLDKPAAAALPTTVAAPLPLDNGQVEVAFGKLLALRARSDGKQTGVRVQMGSDRVTAPAPAAGLVVSGRTPSLDAIDWVAMTAGSKDDDGLPLREIDVAADHLLLLGSDFPGTRLRLTPAAGAVSVAFQGDSLAGTLQVPKDPRATISGRLSRVYWRAPAAAADGDGVPPAEASPVDDFDPAGIPPLALDIDDLHFGDAALGTARLRTRQTPTGMQVEQLQMQAPKQKVDISGDWLGRGAAARTRLSASVDSQDMGTLLGGFGLKGRIGGGHGQLQMQTSWAGSPAGFSLGALQGTMKIGLRDGQLLEVEPGAGRVLGLLSVAQLPRRILLDFRDFFDKGFAFNRIDGNVAFDGGVARSDDMVIDGPAAEIRIRGNTDLHAQQFDQTIDVLPKSGNLLTVVGAVAGGPLGAAVGAAANAVLHKPLGEIAAKTYRVTGPWSDPKVEVIGREQSRAEQAQAARGGIGD